MFPLAPAWALSPSLSSASVSWLCVLLPRAALGLPRLRPLAPVSIMNLFISYASPTEIFVAVLGLSLKTPPGGPTTPKSPSGPEKEAKVNDGHEGQGTYMGRRN